MKIIKTVLASALAAAMLATPAVAAEVPKAAPAKPAEPAQPFGDWRLQCTKAPSGEGVCALRQKLVSDQTKKPVAAFAFARRKDSKELRLAAVLPLGLDIPVPVTGKVGDGAPFQFRVRTCLPRGCIASVIVDDAMLEALSSAPGFSITFKMRPVQQSTTFTVSLKGFADGLKALDAR